MTDNAEDKKETRDHLKKYRFTQTELDQIEVVLKKQVGRLRIFFELHYRQNCKNTISLFLALLNFKVVMLRDISHLK